MKGTYNILFLLILACATGCTKKAQDKCATVACKNGGTCADGICTCPTGYTGTYCETASNGNINFYLAQDFNLGNVAVTINGVTETARDFSTAGNCDWEGYALFNLPPGNYDYTAAAGNVTWHGNIPITPGQCTNYRLDYSAAAAPILKGAAGSPRFNLSFTDQSANIDLHVTTPDGTEIYWNNTSGGGGKMDITYSLPESNPQENIWFSFNAPVHGVYKVWAVYSVLGSYPSQNFTIKVLDGLSVVKTYSGVLTTTANLSPVYEYTY